MVTKNFYKLEIYYKNCKQINLNDMKLHKHFGYNCSEDFYNDIIFLCDINEIKIIEDGIYRNEQNEFRINLVKKYKQCIISGHRSIECQACHIIPVSHTNDYNILNGILLNACLHITFDKYLWSINPDTLTVEIISKNIDDVGTICDYDGEQVIIDVNSVIYLRIHYNKFLDIKKIFEMK